jgi:cell division GTPase FtsZ
MREASNDNLTVSGVTDVASAVEEMVDPQALMLWSMDITSDISTGQMCVTSMMTKCVL